VVNLLVVIEVYEGFAVVKWVVELEVEIGAGRDHMVCVVVISLVGSVASGRLEGFGPNRRNPAQASPPCHWQEVVWFRGNRRVVVWATHYFANVCDFHRGTFVQRD